MFGNLFYFLKHSVGLIVVSIVIAAMIAVSYGPPVASYEDLQVMTLPGKSLELKSYTAPRRYSPGPHYFVASYKEDGRKYETQNLSMDELETWKTAIRRHSTLEIRYAANTTLFDKIKPPHTERYTIYEISNRSGTLRSYADSAWIAEVDQKGSRGFRLTLFVIMPIAYLIAIYGIIARRPRRRHTQTPWHLR